MNLDVLFSPPLLLTLSAGLALILFSLFNLLISSNLTRPTVFTLGIIFIGIGVFGHIYFLDILELCQELAASDKVSQDVLTRLQRYHLVFAYVFPFISGAIGTNIISDALLKHHTYERSFCLVQFLQDLKQILLLPIGLFLGAIVGIFWLILWPINPARRLLRSALPKISRWTYLSFLKISIIARNKLRSGRDSPKEPVSADTP
ncbi:hypothetical protein [Pseudomonas plecoglossicida]|uniref:hypothetical protein n=1 Tax=Pseudomonas plecoglossicida TaxID=70775 RepID=UPI0015E3AB8B|nr:hypothetical protein [Pseudomonas plecoglossicida]MBA1323407.1 hypothetical protein [Pseudomonas plecoglossicida]